MEQINFRVTVAEKKVFDMLAQAKGISTAELAKQAVLKDISQDRVDLAFDLLKQGKAGRKQAWFVSGLDGRAFLAEWTRRGAAETIPDETIDRELDDILKIDLKKYMRKKPEP
jgi:hypothetical protein